MVYRFGAPFYFANATLFRDEVERLATQAPTPARWFMLDAQAMVDFDTTGATAQPFIRSSGPKRRGGPDSPCPNPKAHSRPW